MKNKNILVGILVPLLLAGCTGTNGNYGFPASQAEANREYTERIAQHDREVEQADRVSKAQATEIATRHNPTSVSNTEVFAPTFNH